MNKYMKIAIREALLGLKEGGIPIGAILTKNEKIIGHGHNRRVQECNPILHAEIDCLRNAGRIGSYKNTILYSTLIPCYLCAGAIVQFGIKKVIIGENETFKNGSKEFMEYHGIKIINLNLTECKIMMKNFIKNCPDLWNEDIGKL